MKTETLEVDTTSATKQSIGGQEAVIDLAPIVLHIANILVPLDFSDTSLKALHYAIPFAKQFNAKLTLVNVVDRTEYPPEMAYLPPSNLDIVAARNALEEVRDKNVPEEIPTELVVRGDLTAETIIEVAKETKADLIITATHGRTGLKHLFLGSVAEKIVRQAPCPVLVVRQKERDFV